MTTGVTRNAYKGMQIEEYVLQEEPFYLPVGDEIEIFEAAYKERIPLLFKGPTGCGKTRFVEYMAYRLGQPLTVVKPKGGKKAPSNDNASSIPLVTVACHEDLTASDLVGRYLLEGDATVWIDGPLTRAVKAGGICYLDEVVEARRTPPFSSTHSPTIAESFP
jgi:nitric oxide reductase NorQ protein